MILAYFGLTTPKLLVFLSKLLISVQCYAVNLYNVALCPTLAGDSDVFSSVHIRHMKIKGRIKERQRDLQVVVLSFSFLISSGPLQWQSVV